MQSSRKNFFVFNCLSIYLPSREVLLKILGYPTFMKELVTKKRSMDFEMVEVSHISSAIMKNSVVIKRDYSGTLQFHASFGYSIC